MFRFTILDMLSSASSMFLTDQDEAFRIVDNIIISDVYQKYESYEPVSFDLVSMKLFLKQCLSEGTLKKYIEEFQPLKKIFTDELYADCSEMAYKYLPTFDYKEADIYFSVFNNEGLAWGYDPILIDISKIGTWMYGIKEILGHELHHFYKNQVMKINIANIDKDDESAIDFIHRIMAEGTAELISSTVFDRSISLEKENSIKNTLENISYANIQELLDHLTEIRCISRLSFHIAKTVMIEKGINEIKNSIVNPFNLIYLYNECSTKVYDLSKFKIDFVNLEKRYINL